jgi:hypothetical protein
VIKSKKKKNEIAWKCGTRRKNRNPYRALVGKPEGKKPLGRSRPRGKDNIEIGF